MSTKFKDYLRKLNEGEANNYAKYKNNFAEETLSTNAIFNSEEISKLAGEEKEVAVSQDEQPELTEIDFKKGLSKYVPNRFSLDAIVKNPQLTNQIKHTLVLNWKTSVEKRLDGIKGATLSINQLVKLLLQIYNEVNDGILEVYPAATNSKPVKSEKQYSMSSPSKYKRENFYAIKSKIVSLYNKSGGNPDLWNKLFNEANLTKKYKTASKFSETTLIKRLDEMRSYSEMEKLLNVAKQAIREEDVKEEDDNGGKTAAVAAADTSSTSYNDEYYYEDEVARNLDAFDDFNIYFGNGLSKKKELSPQHHKINEKYYVDMNKLQNNILEIRYVRTRHLIPIKSQYITTPVKTLILKTLQEHKVDTKTYNSATESEKHLFRTLIPYLNLKDGGGLNDGFQKEFEIIRGEILAGNDSKLLKRKAKAYLLQGLQTGLLSRHNYVNMIFELDL